MASKRRVRIGWGRDGDLVLAIRHPVDLFVALLLAPALLLLGVPLGFLREALGGGGAGAWGGLVASVVVLAPGLFVWLHDLTGRERLRVGPDALCLERRVLGVTFYRRHVLRARLRDVRFVDAEFEPRNDLPRRVGLSRGSIGLVTAHAELRFGANLDRAWAADIIGLLQTWLNGGAVLPPGARAGTPAPHPGR